MTRKDYTAIAGRMRDVLTKWTEESTNDAQSRYVAKSVVTAVVIELADVLAADNSRFDRARFLSACGLEN